MIEILENSVNLKLYYQKYCKKINKNLIFSIFFFEIVSAVHAHQIMEDQTPPVMEIYDSVSGVINVKQLLQAYNWFARKTADYTAFTGPETSNLTDVYGKKVMNSPFYSNVMQEVYTMFTSTGDFKADKIAVGYNDIGFADSADNTGSKLVDTSNGKVTAFPSHTALATPQQIKDWVDSGQGINKSASAGRILKMLLSKIFSTANTENVFTKSSSFPPTRFCYFLLKVQVFFPRDFATYTAKSRGKKVERPI